MQLTLVSWASLHLSAIILHAGTLMKSLTVVPTKVNPPHIRTDVVIRPRMMEILNEGSTRPSAFMLVSAPAGYGKTTLIVSWLRSINQPYAWLSLGAEDDN